MELQDSSTPPEHDLETAGPADIVDAATCLATGGEDHPGPAGEVVRDLAGMKVVSALLASFELTDLRGRATDALRAGEVPS